MGVAIKNPWSAKFISAKCFTQPIHEKISLVNLALYGHNNIVLSGSKVKTKATYLAVRVLSRIFGLGGGRC